MSVIRKRLGLDWTRKSQHWSDRPESSEYSSRNFGQKHSEDFMQDALLAYAPRVMKFMSNAPDRTTVVFELVDHLGEPVSVLGPVLANLRDQGYVDMLNEDSKGNHEIRLTDRGLNVVT